jgi:hypothetical protein
MRSFASLLKKYVHAVRLHNGLNKDGSRLTKKQIEASLEYASIYPTGTCLTENSDLCLMKGIIFNYGVHCTATF